MSSVQDNAAVEVSIDVALDGRAKLGLSFPKQGKMGDHTVKPVQNNQSPIQTFRIPSKTLENGPALRALDEKLEEITLKWLSEANKREIQSESLPKEKQELAHDCACVVDLLHDMCACDALSPNEYIAINSTTNEIQGIATLTIQEEGPEIGLIGARPSNIDLFVDDHPIRGTGTALITHIFKDVKQGDLSQKNLTVRAFPSAIAFYEHIGFVHNKTKIHYNTPCFLYDVPASEIVKYEKLGCVQEAKNSDGSALIVISQNNLEKLDKKDQMTIQSHPTFLAHDPNDDKYSVSMAITAKERDAFLEKHESSLSEISELNVADLK